MDETTHKKHNSPSTLRDMFMDKNPKPGRWIPRFAFNLLSGILRIDFFNYPLLYEYGYKKDVKDHVYIFVEDPEKELSYIHN